MKSFKSRQRRPSEGLLFLDLEKKERKKNIFGWNCFQGSLKDFFWALQKIFNTCKNFQKLKMERTGGQTYLFWFFVFISWIGTFNPNGIHLGEKIYQVDQFKSHP